MKVQPSKLLELLNSRKSWNLPPYHPPRYDRVSLQRVAEAVRCVATLDNSDPHSGSRAKLYLMKGYCLPSEVLKDCKTQTALRAHEPRGGMRNEAELLPLKAEAMKKMKQKEMDKAWNQARSAQYLEDKKAA